MPDSSLKISKRDPRAFADFYRQHAVGLTGFFARRVVDADTALDLVAETFAQAYASRRRFRGSSDEEAKAWLYTIASRQFAKYLRRGYAEQAAMQRLGLERPAGDAEDLRRVEELGAMDARRGDLARRLDDLPEDHREAIRLRVVDELSYRDVAMRLGISEPAARMRVSRALQRLRSSPPDETAAAGPSPLTRSIR